MGARKRHGGHSPGLRSDGGWQDGRGISTLRLWKATAPGMDMTLFNQGEYMRAMEQKAMAEVITQVLYPADNHREGKSCGYPNSIFWCPPPFRISFAAT